MKIWIALLLATFAVGASAQCTCESFKWATCDGTPCQCGVMVGTGEMQNLNCSNCKYLINNRPRSSNIWNFLKVQS
ncbi:unnamed protein product [Oncorhynchus mykiss]|uniref:Uncharacterized protein n=1 Tax=Oncorhynchus mykiss TaxID=8022 RepID=A0A060ZIB4_ONCMY|nr:unnamed protein product [Oncorhynchus mykiss]